MYNAKRTDVYFCGEFNKFIQVIGLRVRYLYCLPLLPLSHPAAQDDYFAALTSGLCTVYLYFLGLLCYWRRLFRRPQVRYFYCLPLLPWSLPGAKGDYFNDLMPGLYCLPLLPWSLMLLKVTISTTSSPVFVLSTSASLESSCYERWQFRWPHVRSLHHLPLLPWCLAAAEGVCFANHTSGLCIVYYLYSFGVFILAKHLFHPCGLLYVRLLGALLFRDPSFKFERHSIRIFIMNFQS